MAKRTLLRTLLRLLLPSFIADIFFPEHKPTWRLHPTSYLDGLRGIASVLVFFCHFTEELYPPLTPTYGLDPDKPSAWIQLPFARLLFSGRPMVHIFFVISGFVLSYKPIKAIHARDFDKCYSALSSSTFRRAFRLFGPCIASTFMIMCLAQRGLLHIRYRTFSEQFWAWKHIVFHKITWPWEWETNLSPWYDAHLWTIPVEFAHSMLLFIVILGLVKIRLRIRQATVFGLMLYCLACGRWAGFEFLTGLFLAEIHVLQNAQQPGWDSPEKGLASPKAAFRSLKTISYFIITAVCLFIYGWPNAGAEKTPGIRFFLAHTPDPYAALTAKENPLASQQYWFALTGAVMVWIVGDTPVLKKLFEGPVAQYCGRISYAIYIMHGPVMGLCVRQIVGNVFIPASGEPGTPEFKEAVMARGIKGMVGISTTKQLTTGWVLGIIMVGAVVVWAADIFWRAVDDPIVKFGRRIEMYCVDDVEEKPRGRGYSQAV